MISLHNFYRFIKALIEGVRKDSDFKIISLFLVILLIGATIFYTKVENWSMIDSLYFSIMTMATVGYGDLIPTTYISKLFTVFFTIISIGAFVSFTAKLAKLSIEHHSTDRQKRKLKRKEKKKAKNILKILNWRYATKRMTEQKVNQRYLNTILEAIRLSPSAYGLQPYKVIVTGNKELINTIFEKACPQPVIQQCSHLIIFKTLKKVTNEYVEKYLENMQITRNVDNEYIENYRNKISSSLLSSSTNNFNWATHQTYLTLGFTLYVAAQLQVDATPIEGFDPDALNKILELDTEKESTTLMLTLGYRNSKEDHLAKVPKVRQTKEEFIEIK